MAKYAVTPTADDDPNRFGFEARYGPILVSQSIATFPSVLLRWQGALELSDFDMLTVLGILSFRPTAKWPSVSVVNLTRWRGSGCTRKHVDASMRHLEELGFLKRSKDPQHGSNFCDLSGLMAALERAASMEREIAESNKRTAALRVQAEEHFRNRAQVGKQIENIETENEIEVLKEDPIENLDREQDYDPGERSGYALVARGQPFALDPDDEPF